MDSMPFSIRIMTMDKFNYHRLASDCSIERRISPKFDTIFGISGATNYLVFSYIASGGRKHWPGRAVRPNGIHGFKHRKNRTQKTEKVESIGR